MPGRLSRVIPYYFFVISGGFGLVYEVTWSKYLSLFLGNTSLAYMCVLATFMGGLAFGSFVIGSASPRIRRPLAAYGWLEVAIGLYAIAFPLIIRPVQSAALAQAGQLGFGTPGLAALKLAIALGLLLLPTILMGGTFPLLMKHFQPRSPQVEDKAEWLYASNCGGAVLGALLAGFVLIPSIGLRQTLWDVGLANTLLGAAAIALGTRSKVVVESVSERVRVDEDAGTESRRLLRPVYIAIAVSGATSMVYELVWIRIFAIALGGTTYAFSLMVAAFITGIAVGSLAVGTFARLRRNPLLTFAIAEVAIGAAVLASLPIYQMLPYIFWRWASLLKPSPESMWLHNLFQYSLCFIVMLVPTIFFGGTLPLAIKSVARRDDRIGRDGGFVYGANTLGTLVGALLTGLVLLSLLGLRHCLELALAANVAVGAYLLWLSDLRRSRAVAAALVPGAILLLSALPQWHPASLAMGSYGMGEPPRTWADYSRVLNDVKVRYFGEDGSASVAVYMTSDSGFGRPDMIMSINGKPDASSYGDLPTEVLLGQVPMMLKPDARDVLVIGLGSGVTAGSILTHPDASVDCVEISPAVAKGAECFASVNRDVLNDDRFRLILEDARTYVGAAPKKYDVIVSEPSHPWVAGVANLFSLEFFQSADRALKPGGLVVQWFQGYDMSDELAGVLLRTIRRVFPCVYIFEGASDDYILVASREPLKPDFEAMKRSLYLDTVRADMARVGIDSPAAFLGRQLLGAADVARLAGRGPVNTDDLPIIEYKAPVAMYARSSPTALKNSDQRALLGKGLFCTEYLKARPLDPATCISVILSYSDPRTDNPRMAIALLRYYNSRWPGDGRTLAMYSERARGLDAGKARAEAYAAIRSMRGPVTYHLAAAAAMNDLALSNSVFTPQDFGPVLELFDRAIQLRPNDTRLIQERREALRYVR